MNQALLNRNIQIFSKTRTSDGHGGFIVSGVSSISERGRIRPASATEVLQAEQTVGRITHVAYFRYGDFVKIGYELESNGLNVRVKTVRNPGGMNRHLELDCEEIQSEL